jgi:hypothetical protein
MLVVMIYASHILFWACVINYLMLSSMSGWNVLLFFATVLVVGWTPPQSFLSSLILILIALVLIISAEADQINDEDDTDVIEIIFVHRLNQAVRRHQRNHPTHFLRQQFTEDGGHVSERSSAINNKCIHTLSYIANETQRSA